MRALLALSIAVLILGGCQPIYDYVKIKIGIEISPDNPVEEFIENQILKETGIDQDLTPESPEHE